MSNGLGTRPILGRGGRKLRRGEIQPGPMLLIDNGLAYEIVGSGGSQRTLLQANLALYVGPTGSDSANDGLDPTAPFLTWGRALSEVLNSYDLNGYTVTVWIADGTYTAGLTATSAPLGSTAGTGAITFRSTSGVAANVLLGVTGANAITAQGGAQITLLNFTVQTLGTNTSGLVAATGGLIAHSGLIFGPCTLAHMNAANSGFIQATGNYSVSGNAAVHGVASTGGIVTTSGRTVTFIGTPSFSTAYAYAQEGRFEAVGTAYTGGATGSRYLAVENGVVTTNGAGATALPGNAAGSTSSGGQYL